MNATDIVNVIDRYAISTNRGVDVLKYLAIPKFDSANKTHKNISKLSENIHKEMRNEEPKGLEDLESKTK